MDGAGGADESRSRAPRSVSRRALKIVKAMHEARDGDFVFPGQKPGKPLSVMALEMVLRRMKIENATVHGFRSAFRDWAAECTNFTNEVCEAALAHVIENKAEAAYRRGDLFDKRRKLMEAWAAYCAARGRQGRCVPAIGPSNWNQSGRSTPMSASGRSRPDADIRFWTGFDPSLPFHDHFSLCCTTAFSCCGGVVMCGLPA